MLKVMRYRYFISLTTDEAIFDSRPKQKNQLSKKVNSNIWFLTVDILHTYVRVSLRQLNCQPATPISYFIRSLYVIQNSFSVFSLKVD
jgi:hypothetical protein